MTGLLVAISIVLFVAGFLVGALLVIAVGRCRFRAAGKAGFNPGFGGSRHGDTVFNVQRSTFNARHSVSRCKDPAER